MSEKKIFSTRIDNELLRKLKHLAVDEDQSIGALLEEAIRCLLEKRTGEKHRIKRYSF